MKIFPLAFAFVLLSLPAFADDLQAPRQPQLPPQEMPGDETGLSKADRSLSELGRPGEFRWMMLDEDGAPQNEAQAAPLDAGLTRSLMFPADTPTATIEAQMRLVAAQVVDEARRAGNVESFRLRLHVRCVKEDRLIKRDPLETASAPWIWSSLTDDPEFARATVEMCAVSIIQSVQMRDDAAKRRPYSVLLPIGQSDK